jgi:threonine synthase
MLAVLRDTGGDAIAVGERAIEDGQRLLGRLEGIWTAPESAATVAALLVMKDRGQLAGDARVVLVLTGAGIKCEAPPLPKPVDLEGSEEEILETVRRIIG